MRFTKDHEWVELDGDIATVGITAHAAEQLGDVVFVEVPDVGKTVTAGGLGLSGAATLGIAAFVFLATFFASGLIMHRIIKGV